MKALSEWSANWELSTAAMESGTWGSSRVGAPGGLVSRGAVPRLIAVWIPGGGKCGLRILLLTHYYDPEIGPPQLRWSALVREFTQAGHQVDVIAPQPHYPLGDLLESHCPAPVGAVEQGRHGESIHRVAFRPTNGSVTSILLDQLTTAFWTVATVFRKRGLEPDVIIATAPALPTLMAGWLVAKWRRRPLVMEVRDAWPDLLAVVDRWEGAEERRHAKIKHVVAKVASGFITRLQRSADCVVTTTAAFAEVLQGRGIVHVEVIRNTAHPVPDYDLHPPRNPNGELRVVYVGTVGRAQGVDTAVRAVRLAKDQGVHVSLRVVGTGAGKQLVQQTAEELGVEVMVRGAQPRHEIHQHYRWADTFLIMLREWPALSWTVPSKLYEALSLGMHISGSVAGEAARIITKTGGGFVTPPGDALSLAQQWVELARESTIEPDRESMHHWVQEFAEEERVAQSYLRVLEALARKGNCSESGGRDQGKEERLGTSTVVYPTKEGSRKGP